MKNGKISTKEFMHENERNYCEFQKKNKHENKKKRFVKMFWEKIQF